MRLTAGTSGFRATFSSPSTIPNRTRDPIGPRTASCGARYGNRRGMTVHPEDFMGLFSLVSEYKPSGDQPEAIRQLTEGVLRGDRYQTLLGVTGSGKTFTMSNVIAAADKPVLVM